MDFLPGRPYGIATFAGSLSYVKSEELRNALISACRPGGTVVIHVLRILTGELMELVGAEVSPETSQSDHHKELSDWPDWPLPAASR